MEEIELDLSDYFFVLVKPDIFVPTIDAYSMVSPKQPEISLKKIIKKPVSEWKEVMKNDFEPSVFKKYFEICKIKEQLYDRGAVYASMSGSGSSVYAFFEKETDIRFDNCFVWKNKEIWDSLFCSEFEESSLGNDKPSAKYTLPVVISDEVRNLKNR